MSTLLVLLKEMRSRLGITQMELAKRSHVSLPTIQNIEANDANPSLETLLALTESLGLEINLSVKKANWDVLAAYGVPLIGANVRIHKEVNDMIHHLREACMELQSYPHESDRERKL